MLDFDKDRYWYGGPAKLCRRDYLDFICDNRFLAKNSWSNGRNRECYFHARYKAPDQWHH